MFRRKKFNLPARPKIIGSERLDPHCLIRLPVAMVSECSEAKDSKSWMIIFDAKNVLEVNVCIDNNHSFS